MNASARGLTQAYLLMSQIAEKQNDFEAANAWLDRIENADDIMAAQMRRASLLARQGKLDEARAHVAQPTRSASDRCATQTGRRSPVVARIQAMGRRLQGLWRSRSAHSRRINDLVYDQAMMAEKANRLDDDGAACCAKSSHASPITTTPTTHWATRWPNAGLRLPEAKATDRKGRRTRSPMTPTSRTVWAGWSSARAMSPEPSNILQAA